MLCTSIRLMWSRRAGHGLRVVFRPPCATLFFYPTRAPPKPTLFPYTTLFRSERKTAGGHVAAEEHANQIVMFLRSEEPRLNSSHVAISYAVFCLKKKKTYP